MSRPMKPYFIALLGFALMGVLFSGISTYDFIAHLDRQLHSITCSFIPGVGARDSTGTSGCHVVMISPWSSVFRSSTWGGIPISLPALAVFAYLSFLAADLWVRREEHDPDELRYVALATGLPLGMSIVYGVISMRLIGAVCKLCVGVYVSSAGVFLAALLAVLAARRHPQDGSSRPLPWARYGVYFLEGVVFVVVPVLLYLALKPGYSTAMADCGSLSSPEDKYKVMVPLQMSASGAPAIEVLDPLCPACRAFDQRLKASGLGEKLALQAMLFPLDKSCNWMVPETLHPGACAVSEAILCSSDAPDPVLQWAFEHQEELRSLAATDEKAITERIKKDFPRLASCVGGAEVKSRLNKSLRWAVNNALPVVTPQLYVRGEKLCDEDTDLGLEFSLRTMLERQAAAK